VSGVRNLRIVVAGRRSRRSRSPVRHASSSPQMGCRKLSRKGIWPWHSAAFALGTNGIVRHAHFDRRRCLLQSGTNVPADIGPLDDCVRCDIVALVDPRLLDQCASRPSRSSLSANHPVNPSLTPQNRRSGEGLMVTLPKVSRTSVIRTTWPPPVVTTALKSQAAAFISVSGCRECRKLTARCAWAAA